jgi:hypothetical protein
MNYKLDQDIHSVSELIMYNLYKKREQIIYNMLPPHVRDLPVAAIKYLGYSGEHITQQGSNIEQFVLFYKGNMIKQEGLEVNTSVSRHVW